MLKVPLTARSILFWESLHCQMSWNIFHVSYDSLQHGPPVLDSCDAEGACHSGKEPHCMVPLAQLRPQRQSAMKYGSQSRKHVNFSRRM